MLKIIPLGGLGEIGLNMMVFEYRGTLFIVDCGLMFPEDYMLGVDFVIPDMDYIRTNREKVAAVVLTGAFTMRSRKGKAPMWSSCAWVKTTAATFSRFVRI